MWAAEDEEEEEQEVELRAMSLLEVEQRQSGRAAAGGRRLALLQALAALCEGLPHAALLRKTTQVRRGGGGARLGWVHGLPVFALLMYVQQLTYGRMLDSDWSVTFDWLCIVSQSWDTSKSPRYSSNITGNEQMELSTRSLL